uniref:Uncharacterized protein n=1 Tax=Rhizophora mucronata TaxID=61149 RepID=A0A2P2JC32_RHIMU
MQNIRKSPRVADESMFREVNGAAGGQCPIVDRAHRRNGFSAVFGVVLAPFTILSCFSEPRVSGADGLWLSGEFEHLSEMSYLMVNESMRYAMLM